MNVFVDDFSLDFFSLNNKVAIVTGASGELGRGFAGALAKAGANLLLVDIKQPDCEYIQRLMDEDVEVEILTIDITESNAATKIVTRCIERFGQLDILVNNAGICNINRPIDFNRSDWDPMINLNLTAAFDMCQAAIKVFVPHKKGKIINICSVLSFHGGRWSPGYAATKHALAGLTKAYADDFSEYNIQVNGIAPGYYVSEMTSVIYNNPKIRGLIKGRIPAQRWGKAQDLMGAMIFLASSASDYVNGHILVVDGGYSIR
jgi:NAD(P)-dependent dehydrogenase (short-subunit alcohol dehydrogenase family)